MIGMILPKETKKFKKKYDDKEIAKKASRVAPNKKEIPPIRTEKKRICTLKFCFAGLWEVMM